MELMVLPIIYSCIDRLWVCLWLFNALVALCSPFVLFSQGEEEGDRFVVQLGTECDLSPVLLFPLDVREGGYSSEYFGQLGRILQFDLEHGGYLTLKKASENYLGARGDFKEAYPKEKGRFEYALQISCIDKKLQAWVLHLGKGLIQRTAPVEIQGQLSADRKSIHLLTDALHKMMFGVNGIASTHILYTKRERQSKSDVSEVWESDYDGENARQLTHESACCVTPTYIPPKEGHFPSGYLYVSYRIGQPKIYVGSLKGSSGMRLTSLRGNQLMPAVAPTRDRIAFINDVTGNPDLFVQSFTPESGVTAKAQQVFRAKQATQGSPSFSPNGKQLAFVSNKDGSPKIYVLTIPPPGTLLEDVKTTLISKSNRENSAPVWSPDGKKLAYCAKTQGVRQIWIYDFELKRERQLTNGPGNKENPSWAPNSCHIVYNSVDHEGSELFLINLKQTEPVQISRGGGQKRFPSWEPRFEKKESL